ncbi:hypothetical protein DX541_13215 [Vibrio fluvialis]|nr:hypothetical protein [Vibrio fluvialis]
MNKWTTAWLIGLTCSFSVFAFAHANEKSNSMMSDNAQQGQGMMQGQSMMMDDEDMHENMGMSDEEREEYMSKLKACEKDGRSAKECEAKMDRQMKQDGKSGSMHKEAKEKSTDKANKSMDKASSKAMTAQEREEYMMKLKACEKDGRSAKECEAKLDRKMDQDKMMKKDKDQKSKTY